MSEETMPADWVLIEAAKRAQWSDYSHTIKRLRQEYGFPRSTFRALCDMIAKHEQPPADPDVEAVKRVLCSYWGYDISDAPRITISNEAASRAVAQYKLERAK